MVTQLGLEYLKKVEDEIRDTIIKQMVAQKIEVDNETIDTDNDYGKITDFQFINNNIKAPYVCRTCNHNSKYGCKSDYHGSITHYMQNVQQHCNDIQLKYKEFFISATVYRTIDDKTHTLPNANSECRSIICTGCWVILCTNYCNIYELLFELKSSSGFLRPNISVKCIQKTNVVLNKVLINIIKSVPNCIDSLPMYEFYKTLSENITKYWSSEYFGNHAIKYESTCVELQEVKTQCKTLQDTVDAKTQENLELKRKIEQLEKQISDVELFKNCMATLQQHIRQPILPQIGNPIL